MQEQHRLTMGADPGFAIAQNPGALGLEPVTGGYDVLDLIADMVDAAGGVALDKLTRLGWIGAGTWVSIETARDEEIAAAGFEIDASRVHGKARLTLLRAA